MQSIWAFFVAIWNFILSIISIKVFPFAWHCRFIYNYIHNCHFIRKSPIPPSTPDCLTLFHPSIYTTLTPIGEMDFFGHKSNSTYLTDLDMARAVHIWNVFRVGINDFREKDKERKREQNVNDVEKSRAPQGPTSGLLGLAMGGTSCSFRKQIRPGQKYEIWTRVLSWDEKWVYLVSHFVTKAETPAVFVDEKKSQKKKKDAASESQEPTIHAVSISKFVFKEGRKTVKPYGFVQQCGLMPDDSMTSVQDMEIKHAIETRRQDGAKLAQSMAALDEGFDFFQEDSVAFARY
ncbi:hypothetical protein ASPWEDRAFT_40160 [Aspergillus wentii DTO 134E9]|uniref:Thioesterase domain-containing protein n=1 Tax=Aspergillus wentii DTO 134E9 TaxID=1073089 RepID=A0A1L9RJB3_ASPWE|nr:uncharacterized protein ASPWEDRAFT_40160 [Aspergillus wentii DTO 134E9]KAI9932025.1 hypothetical protein MW887_009528 [Aspergillus wentii]OJJ35019.1 hypothetical protein ASPWEDRAFT_40160 [Aspergillus wentii DTO 134E9]